MPKQDAKDLEEPLENLSVSNGRCIIPNLDLVLQDSISYLPGLTNLKLLSVLNKANDLVASVLLETNMRVTEQSL